MGYANIRSAIAPKTGALLSITSARVAPAVFIRRLYLKLHIKEDEVMG